MTMEPREVTLSVDTEAEGVRLDLYLAANISEISRARAQALIHSGHASVDGRAAKPSHKVRCGELIRVKIAPPEPSSYAAEDIPLDILFEDEHIIVVNKPAEMVVHPAAGNRSGTLVNALLARSKSLAKSGGEDRPGIVHRLDRNTSGLLVVARTEAAHRLLSESIGRREVKREYSAIVYGNFSEASGTIDAPIGRSPSDRKRMAVGGLGGREALTRFEVRENLRGISHLAVRLSTGRTHQIRVHMDFIGHPIVGDSVYGVGVKRFHQKMAPTVVDAISGLKAHMLHAEILEFEHPATGSPVRFEAPPPEEFANFLRLAREQR